MSLVLKKAVLTFLNVPKNIYNWFTLKYKKVTYKTVPVIVGKIFISGNGHIVLGESIHINSCMSSNPIGGDTRTIFAVSNGATLKIGDFTGLSNVAISCKKEVIIGNYVKIGGGVKIYDSDFHSLKFDERKKKTTDLPLKKSIELKDGCFIGAHSIILKGVTVGKESIIGAGSVVTKSIPDKEIWGGNPIKFIKKIE